MALIVIVGPTAVGKTAVSIDLARRLDAKIISADSRSVYIDMDIGTAKPSLSERGGIEHWGFDLVEPGMTYSVADFKLGAEQIIAPRKNGGQHTIMVGGTGLYVDSVVLDYAFPINRGIFSVDQVEQMSVDEMRHSYRKYNINLPHDHVNVRRLQSGLLRDFSTASRRELPIDDCIVVGLTSDKDVLKRRISRRIDEMFENGIVNETTNIMNKYNIIGADLPGNAYHIVSKYLEGELKLDDAKGMMYQADLRLAKRQSTWFRRNGFINWMPGSDVVEFIQQEL